MMNHHMIGKNGSNMTHGTVGGMHSMGGHMGGHMVSQIPIDITL